MSTSTTSNQTQPTTWAQTFRNVLGNVGHRIPSPRDAMTSGYNLVTSGYNSTCGAVTGSISRSGESLGGGFVDGVKDKLVDPSIVSQLCDSFKQAILDEKQGVLNPMIDAFKEKISEEKWFMRKSCYNFC